MNGVFQALSHPDRRQILALLKRQGEMSAGALAEHFACTKPTLSHHLRELTVAGLIDREKRGAFVFYRINQSVFEEMVQVLFDLFAVRPAEDGAQGDEA